MTTLNQQHEAKLFARTARQSALLFGTSLVFWLAVLYGDLTSTAHVGSVSFYVLVTAFWAYIAAIVITAIQGLVLWEIRFAIWIVFSVMINFGIFCCYLLVRFVILAILVGLFEAG